MLDLIWAQEKTQSAVYVILHFPSPSHIGNDFKRP